MQTCNFLQGQFSQKNYSAKHHIPPAFQSDLAYNALLLFSQLLEYLHEQRFKFYQRLLGWTFY